MSGGDRFDHWERVFEQRAARKEAKRAIRSIETSRLLVPTVAYHEEPLEPQGLTPAEFSFFNMCRKRGFRAYRHGWPDFLLERPDGIIGVEVKNGSDPISLSQQTTFAALERFGLPVYVWNRDSMDRLIPWRKYRFIDKRRTRRKRAGYPYPNR